MNMIASLVLRLVDRLSQPARTAARAVGDISRAQRAASEASAQWTKGLDELDERLGRLASASLVTDGLDRAGSAVMRRLDSATQSAAQFGRGMTGIGITAQMTDQQLAPLRETILQTAADLGALPSTVQATFAAVLAEGVYTTEAELARASVAVARFQRLQDVLGEPLSDAEAGAFSAALGVSLKLTADQLDRANAMVNRSVQMGGVGGGTLARYLPSQTGAMAGLGFGDTRGLADLLAANQVAKGLAGSSEQAANNVSNLMAALASPEVRRRFEEIGIDLEREIKRGVEAGQSPLMTLARLTRDATSGDQFRIGELFGDRQARDALMALVQNFDEFERQSKALTGDDVMAGYFADLERAVDGPAGAFDRYTSGMSRAGIATGSILAPAVGLAADVLGRVANWMSRGAESGSLLARGAVWAVAAFAGLAVGAAAVGNALIGVLGPMFIMRTLFGTLGGAAIKGFAAKVIMHLGRARLAMVAFNVSMLANPVVLGVVAAVAAVALIAVVIRKYWQPIRAFFVGLGQGLGDAFGPALASLGAMLAPLKPVWDGFASAVGAVVGWFGRLLTPVKATQTQLLGAEKAGRTLGRIIGIAFTLTPIGLFVSGLKMLVRNWAAITGGVSAAWRRITGAVQGGAATVVRVIARYHPLGVVVRNWSQIVGAIRSAIRRIAGVLAWNPVALLASIWGGVSSFFGGLAARFRGFGRALIQGLIGGIRSMLGGVRDAVMNTASSAVNWFRSRLGIRSPSRVFAGLGADVMAGLTLGLARGGVGAVGQVAGVAGALATAMAAPAGAMSAGADAASASAGTPRLGGVHIETLEINVTVTTPPGDGPRGRPPGGGAMSYDPGQLGRDIGRAAADALRARLYDEVD